MELASDQLKAFYDKHRKVGDVEELRDSFVNKYVAKGKRIFGMVEKHCDDMMHAAFLLGSDNEKYDEYFKSFSKRARGLGVALDRLNKRCQSNLNAKTIKYEIDMTGLYDSFYGVMADSIAESLPLVGKDEKINNMELLSRMMFATGNSESLKGQDAVLKSYDVVLNEVIALYNKVKNTELNSDGLWLVLEKHRLSGNGYGLGGLRGKLNIDRMLAGSIADKL